MGFVPEDQEGPERSYWIEARPGGEGRALPASPPKEHRVNFRHEMRLASPRDPITQPVLPMDVETGRSERTTYRVETREEYRNDPWAFMSESRTVVVLREE